MTNDESHNDASSPLERPRYDVANCLSLFGYAAEVHARSGGVCQLCGGGADRLDFDWWRQLTVEHLVGQAQSGYLKDVRMAVARRYPELDPALQGRLVEEIDEANTVTACSFCNSTTSRARAAATVAQLLQGSPDDPAEAATYIRARLQAI